MTEDTESYITHTPGQEYAWVLTVDSTEIGAEARLQETFDTVEALFEAFAGFSTPTNVEYVLQYTEVGYDERPPIDTLTPVTETIENEDGVTATDLVDAVRGRIPETATGAWVTRITIQRTRTKLSLGEDYWVDAESDRFRSPIDDDDEPADDVFRIVLFSSGLVDGEPPEYQIVVRTYTDHWFGDSKSAQINCDRLTAALSSLTERLPVSDIFLDSDTYSKEDMCSQGGVAEYL